jgi:crotonobetainyl-CoA:carnitine CoA-transferase CaiB-like acyl-CoA transferase
MGANPLVMMYETKDGRVLSLMSLQAGKYWPSMAECIGRPELATDERFADHHSLLAHSLEAQAILREAFASATLDEWRERLAGFTGQWCVVQNSLEASVDPQTVANGYVAELESSKGIPFKLVTSPIQFGGQPAQPRRAPDFNEHGDELLADLGLDWDAIIDLKVRGIIA